MKIEGGAFSDYQPLLIRILITYFLFVFRKISCRKWGICGICCIFAIGIGR